MNEFSKKEARLLYAAAIVAEAAHGAERQYLTGKRRKIADRLMEIATELATIAVDADRGKEQMAKFDADAFKAALKKAASDPHYAPALQKLMSEPIERILYPESHWVATGWTDELRVTFHPGDGYLEFMAALRT